MGTDADFAGLPGLKFEEETDFPDSQHHLNFTNGYKSNDSFFDVDLSILEESFALPDPDSSTLAPPYNTTMEGDSPSDDNDFSETFLSYISQMLMEEDMEEKPCTFHDPLVLQAAETSLYHVLGEKHPSSSDQSRSYGDQFLVDIPDDGLSSSTGDYSSNSCSTSNTSSSVEQQHSITGEFEDFKPSFLKIPLPSNFVFQSTASSYCQQPHETSNDLRSSDNNSFGTNIMVPNLFNVTELSLQFQRGVEEANRFLPKVDGLVVDLANNASIPGMKEKDMKVVANEEKEDSRGSIKGKKNHERQDEHIDEERSNKQSAVYVDDSELAEVFDKVLVCTGEGCRLPDCMSDSNFESRSNKALQRAGPMNGSSGSKTRVKRQGNTKEVVDLRNLLILCAQAVSGGDSRTADEMLKKIKLHSSPLGDGSQRLAHCFANGLEARLAGRGTQIYTSSSLEKASAADMLKGYLAYISVCPFNKMAIIFANHNILAVSKNLSTLHIIDFGILYGFQWPGLIYRLSKRAGGPPKLRITGIELSQSGFRPGERVEQTGQLLAKYCKLHNVPFEFNAIAKKWETIQIEDLKLNHDEVIAVNCLLRSKNLLDETVVVNSPRNAVLNLIRKTNADIFVHAIVNGSYNAPFFVTRFREALFHFSALFDMFDTNMSREDEMRLKFEKEFIGREALNVVACEGSERVERPETYKQWQVRSMRAGFKQLPLEPLLMKKLKCKLKSGYHEDFMVDQDGQWMLQGWKGRIICGSSAWIPA